jgi:hypothetical protein
MDETIFCRNLAPKRRGMSPAFPVFVYPFVERVREALLYIVSQDMEPRLIDIRCAAAGEGEHELGASASAWKDKTTPLFGVDIRVAFLECIQGLGSRILRMRGTVAHEE